MYVDKNDNRMPREGIDNTFLRRVLAENGQERCARESVGQGTLPCNPDRPAADYCLNGFSLGMVYSPCQQWRNAYDLDTALMRGTLFRELDMPWEVPAPTLSAKGGRCCGQ